MKSHTVSARVTMDEFAKARDGMIAKGIPPEKLTTNSNIVRAAILMCVIMDENPNAPASQESISIIKQLWKVTKRDKKLSTDDLY